MAAREVGSFDELMAGVEPDLRAAARRLRDLIFSVHPRAVEVVRLGERSATYGLGPRKMSEGYAYILPYKRWVALGFFRGVDLPDPTGILEGTGTRMRHVKVPMLGAADDPALRTLIEEAVKERREALGL